MENIYIHWHGPYYLSRAHLADIAFEKGLYSITRKFGHSEKLLYIGRTKRELAQRIYEHEWWLSELRGQVLIRYGLIELQPGKRLTPAKHANIESLLIVYHAPMENTSNAVYYNGRLDLTIYNKGRHGLLSPTVSTEDLEWA